MAFENLNTPTLLRMGMGIKYLLKPNDWQEEKKADINANAVPRIGRLTTRSNSTLRQSPKFQSPAPGSPTQEPAPPQPVAPAWKPLDKEKWPQVWQNAFSRAQPGVIGWTYMNLGLDMSAASNDDAKSDRRAIIANIIKFFASPKGTHTFWPCALPDTTGNLAINGDIFWSGLKFLNCRALVIMDNNASRELLGLSSPPTSFRPPQRVHGIFVWAIEDMADLIRKPDSFNLTMNNLKRAFRNFLPAVFGKTS